MVFGNITLPGDPDDILFDLGPKYVTAIMDNSWFAVVG